jgi:hypothetical protein
MSLWILQLIFNSLSTLALVFVFIQRRQLQDLESKINFLESRMPEPEMEVREARMPIQISLEEKSPTINPERQHYVSMLGERGANDMVASAKKFISQGLPLREVNQKTGLSMSELQLLSKMGQGHELD